MAIIPIHAGEHLAEEQIRLAQRKSGKSIKALPTLKRLERVHA